MNLGGRTLRRLGVEPPALDADSLHRAAYRRAGSSRYGAWDFAEPLERLLKSYRDEADAHDARPDHRARVLVSLLDNLLRMEAERAANPSIEQQRIAAPVFIIGLPRTGTTHLHGLISEDPAQSRAADVGGHVSRRRRAPPPTSRARARKRTRGSAGPIASRRSSCASIRSRPTCRRNASRSRRKSFMSIQFHTTHDVRVVSELVRGRARRSSASTFTIASCSTCKRRRRGRPLGAQSAGTSVRARGLARALSRRANHPHASRSAARHGVDGESRDGAAARVQRQRRSAARSLRTGPTAGRERSTSFSPCAIARRRRNSSTSTSSRSSATRSAPSSASTIFSVGR